MPIEMYMKPDCPYCKQAREHFTASGIEFVEYDAQNDLDHQRRMLEITGGDLTVPAIVENGAYVGSGWGDPPRG
jgi:glutaredoxin 3